MAGLLDIFGSTPDIYAGLLGEEGMAQAKRQAQSDALLNLSASLMKAGAPSRTPQGLGLGLVEGMQAAGRGYKESMQGALQEKLAQQKIAEALASKQRAGAAQQLLTSALQPQMVPEATTGPSGVPYPVNQVRQATLQELIPQFAKYGTEGFEALKTYADIQKSARPETVTLGEGQQLFERQADGSLKVIGGAPKIQKLGDKEGNAALLLYGTSDIDKIRDIPGAVDAIRKEAINQRLAEKPQINLSDPTAVQSQQLKTINQWEGLLNQNKTQEVADRANAFYGAYNLARGGNTNADGAIIYHVAKSYDPGGVVQASDISTVTGVRGMPDVIAAAAQKVSKGGSLLPKERENLKVIMDDIVEKKKKSIQPSLETYRGINKNLGGNESAIVNPFDYIEKPKSLDEILGGGR